MEHTNPQRTAPLPFLPPPPKPPADLARADIDALMRRVVALIEAEHGLLIRRLVLK